MPTELQRFWSKVQVLDNGCWQWMASDKGNGYGQFKIKGQQSMISAHVYAYEMLVGPIPEGFEIDHLCRNRRCINPKHLEAVTPRINCLRGISPFAENYRKTHCINGHLLEGENVYRREDRPNTRTCLKCMRLTSSNQQRAVKPKFEFCKRGHKMDGENLGRTKKQFYCKQCKNEMERNRRAIRHGIGEEI